MCQWSVGLSKHVIWSFNSRYEPAWTTVLQRSISPVFLSISTGRFSHFQGVTVDLSPLVWKQLIQSHNDVQPPSWVLAQILHFFFLALLHRSVIILNAPVNKHKEINKASHEQVSITVCWAFRCVSGLSARAIWECFKAKWSLQWRCVQGGDECLFVWWIMEIEEEFIRKRKDGSLWELGEDQDQRAEK